MKKTASTYREFRSDASKCEVALLMIREEAQKDLEEGRITPEQFELLDRRLEQYLKELKNLIGDKR